LHPNVEKLLAVQKVDQAIARIRRDLDSVPSERQQREQALQTIRDRHADHVARMKKAEVAAHDNEISIRSADEEIKKLETRLNTVKNNAEYQATLLQIESVRGERSRTEEAGLALIEEIESLRVEVERSKSALDEEETVFAEFQEKIRALEAEREAQLGKVSAGRQDLVAAVPADLMAKYERMFVARGGLAVCAVDGETCTGCYTSIPPNLMVKLRASSAVVQCDSCQRILYLAE
jgi:predicted  nucleic acid-binding Zn-ribbon protein